ncbi:nephrin-like [Limulus polyphemus]|uniref:Nephrin-like n=1 Tax=Limulus polyphemus TaxID=6850 RepID=A0ABM1RZX3_LIMPO|nr:nephrin-like [Limulus polyphemus]
MALRASYIDIISSIIIIIFSTFVIFPEKGVCQRQYFRVKPRASEVIQGQTIDLQCQIANLAGAVQWSKDGFVLGYDPDIPGYPRYVMVIDSKNGIYNLRVSDAQLRDEGEYQCQVGPAPGNSPIRSQANLTVLVPPRRVEIRHRSNGSVLEVREAERISLTCYAHQSKPHSQLKWYRNRVELKEPVPYEVEQLRNNKLFTTSSSIILHTKLEDNDATYTCEAIHPTLRNSLIATVRISVLYPPGPPEIEGFQEDDIVQIGDTLTVACISRGGNPPAKLVWLRNDVQINKIFSTTGYETTNTHSFLVTAADNKATYRCEATNSVTLQPLESSVTLNVLFPPSQVSIKGPHEGKIGDNITLRCIAGPSNPESELSWIVDGLPVFSIAEATVTSMGSWFTTSNVSLTLSRQDPDTKTFSCVALNKILNEKVTQTANLTVIYPPGPPSVENHNRPIILGEIKQLTCVSFGGNPWATIRWFKGDTEVPAVTKLLPNGVASSLVIQAEASDNGAVYRCEASNLATIQPLVVSVTTKVIFPPADLNIEVLPNKPREYQIVTIECESGSSNPESNIQWWKNDKLINGGVVAISKGDYGGKITKSRLRFNVTSEDDGSIFVCQATNPKIHRSVHETITLEILYKPKFLIHSLKRFDVVEGEPAFINITAKGNPSSISYQWFHEGKLIVDPSAFAPWSTQTIHHQDIFARNSVLEITRVSRNHAGYYVCEATNSEGSTRIEVIINVLYQAFITKVSHVVLVNEEDDAQLECAANGNPLTEDTIRWTRSGFDMSRTQLVSRKGQTIFKVFNVSRKDAGTFHCLAYNGIGEEIEARALLVVKFKPVVHLTRQLLNVAVDQGNTARLVCVAESAPNVTFSWSLDNGVVIEGYLGNSKYTSQKAQLDETMWESVLFIKNVTDSDYGTYMCIAKNQLGVDNIMITLRRKGKPDPPENVRVLNATDDSINLGWIPGFNGGSAQEFRIRYHESNSPKYKFTQFLPESSVFVVIKGLKPQSEYRFEVVARNRFGESSYTDVIATTRTLDTSVLNTSKIMVSSTDEESKGYSSLLIIVGVISCLCLVFLNFVFVIFILKKRKRNQENQGNTTSERKTFEVYSPRKYQEKINGDTLYPVHCDNSEIKHDIKLKEVPNKRKNKEEQTEQGKAPSDNELPGDTGEDENRGSRETDKDCPDILKNPGLSSMGNCEAPKREYNKLFMNSGGLQRKDSSHEAVGTCNVLCPSAKTTKGNQVHAGKESTVQSRDLVMHTSSKPQKYIVGKVGVHVV